MSDSLHSQSEPLLYGAAYSAHGAPSSGQTDPRSFRTPVSQHGIGGSNDFADINAQHTSAQSFSNGAQTAPAGFYPVPFGVSQPGWYTGYQGQPVSAPLGGIP